MKLKKYLIPIVFLGVITIWCCCNLRFRQDTTNVIDGSFILIDSASGSDLNTALNTLFTGLAFAAAGAAYWTQRSSLKEVKKQTVIAREQNMDAACFEYLNYLERRKLAIDESGNSKQPFNWLKNAYNKNFGKLKEDDCRTLLQNSGTWYRTIMLWLDRVVTAYPNEQKKRTRYANMLLSNLSLDEQRCLQLYAYCAKDISYEKLDDKDSLHRIVTFLKENKLKNAIHSFLEKNNKHHNKIKLLLTEFFENNPCCPSN